MTRVARDGRFVFPFGELAQKVVLVNKHNATRPAQLDALAEVDRGSAFDGRPMRRALD